MMKKVISANLYQKCLILCIEFLLDVLHNMSIPVLLLWQHTGFQILKVLLSGHLCCSVLIFASGASSA